MGQRIRKAIIVGASSGIGEALARQLFESGWELGLLARRVERLDSIAKELGEGVLIGHADVSSTECAEQFRAMIEALGREIDLVVISAGVGYLNLHHTQELDREALQVNVIGFKAIVDAAVLYFERSGSKGQLAAITSIAALRGSAEATAYAASKAFQSTYLDGLRGVVREKKLPLTITELQPGFVNTAMMKTVRPLSPILRGLLVSDVHTAARQMLRAIANRKEHAYITRRYALVAFFLKLLPRPGTS